MRIGLVIYGSLDTLSGGYLYDRMLVAALHAAGHEVILFSLPWRSYPAHLTDNLAIAFAARLAAARLDLLLQDELNHPSLFWLNQRLHHTLACPIVAVVHHLRSQETHAPALLPLYRAVERAYLATVDGCIYNSQTTRDTVEALLGRAIPHIIAYPAGDHIHPPARAEVLELLARRSASIGPLQVLFVGNVIARKGLHTLVSALAALPCTQWQLQIVGNDRIDPSYSRRVRTLAARADLNDNLIWHGALDDAALRRQWCAADLLAVPSYEGFGIVYLEAMAFGLPVIASTAGAAHEIITPGANGYLVAPDKPAHLASYLNTLATNRSQLAVLGYHAHLRFERHPTWQASMARAVTWLHEAHLGNLHHDHPV
jgi:glycosyltransferase involved in cell wall biosynthesis